MLFMNKCLIYTTDINRHKHIMNRNYYIIFLSDGIFRTEAVVPSIFKLNSTNYLFYFALLFFYVKSYYSLKSFFLKKKKTSVQHTIMFHIQFKMA